MGSESGGTARQAKKAVTTDGVTGQRGEKRICPGRITGWRKENALRASLQVAEAGGK